MQTAEIMVINKLETGTAFGSTIVGNENVFIPAKIMTLLEAKVGDRLNAILIENKIHPEKTPWMAIRIDRIGDMDRKDFGDDLAERILADLSENGSATVDDVASALGRPVVGVVAKMQEMVRSGLIMRRTFYAVDEADFGVPDE
jgi:hypothetical protein